MQQQKKNTDTVNLQLAEEYQSQINALKQEKKLVIRNYQEKEKNFLDTIHKLEMDRRSAETTWELELNQLKQSNSKQVGDLQMELQRQRNRSIDLLSDKDIEIEKLQRLAYDQKDYYNQPSSTGKMTTTANTAAVLPTSNIENNHLEEFEDFLISAPVNIISIINGKIYYCFGFIFSFYNAWLLRTRNLFKGNLFLKNETLQN